MQIVMSAYFSDKWFHYDEIWYNESDNDYDNKKAVLPQGNRAMLQVFFSVEVRQQHSLQV